MTKSYYQAHREQICAKRRAMPRTARAAEQQRAWRLANKERRREYDRLYQAAHRDERHKRHVESYSKNREAILSALRKRSFGVEDGDVETLLKQQGGRCGICGTDNPGKHDFALDHDHATGAIRGMLCHRCNGGLGMFRDDPTVIEKAIAYLKRFSGAANFARNVAK